MAACSPPPDSPTDCLSLSIPLQIFIPKYGIEAWQGYETAIRRHESDLFLTVHTIFKLLRCENARDALGQCRDPNSMIAKVAGRNVLTRYNNRIYRVTSIDFTKTPMSTFEHKGKQVSFLDYYKQAHNITIYDTRQPLLLVKVKKSQLRPGQSEEIFLVPEVCQLTDIPEEMRKNKATLRELSKHTRMNPEDHQNQLKKYADKFMASEKSVKAFRDFGMELEQKPAEIPARVLNPPKVLFGGGSSVAPMRADWTGDLWKRPIFNAGTPLTKWVVLVPERGNYMVEGFLNFLRESARKLGVILGVPEM